MSEVDLTVDLSRIFDPKTSNSDIQKVVAEYCRIDLANLDEALSRHAALYAYTVAAYEMAKVQEARAKWSLEMIKSEVFKILGQQDKRVTVAAAERRIPLAVTTQAGAQTLFDAQVLTARLRALVMGLEHRRDMLIQISARQRQEMAL